MEQTEKPFFIKGLKFFPKWHENGFISYNGMLENLRLSISGDRMFINNSWHKFHRGENYSNYTHREIIETYYKLEDKIGVCLDGAKVKKIAYGCVIRENPYLNFPNWLLYKIKEPVPMYHKGHIYGNSFDLTDYRIKGYDKTFEVWKHTGKRIEQNYFRIENEVKYMRHLHNRKEPIRIYEPKDIFKVEVMYQLCEDLLTKYRTIIKRPLMTLEGLSTHELNIIATMQNDFVRAHLKKEHPKTYKRYKQQFAELTTGKNADYYNDVESKVKTKFVELITG